MQSNFRGIQAQIDIIRSAMQDLDGYYDETICALLVEYIPVISSSFFKRWLVASSRQHRHRSIQQTILRNIEHLAVTPVMKDFVFYISKASSLIGMPASFATSQVWLQDNISFMNIFADVFCRISCLRSTIIYLHPLFPILRTSSTTSQNCHSYMTYVSN